MTNKQAIKLLSIIYTILNELDNIPSYLYSNLVSQIKELEQEIGENE